MASTILKKTKPVTLAAFARDVARRKSLSGISELPLNSGNRRTKSKKALLQAIEATGNSWTAR